MVSLLHRSIHISSGKRLDSNLLSTNNCSFKFSDKIKKSQEVQINSTERIVMFPTRVNPKTRLPCPPPVRPLPIGERGSSSPVTVGDTTFSSKLPFPVPTRERHDHPNKDRVDEHHSPNSTLATIKETKALFNPEFIRSLPDLQSLSPTVKKKCKKGLPSSPQTNDFDHIQYEHSYPSETDESISVMATTKSVFPSRQQHHHRVERSVSITETLLSDADTLQCSNHWNSFPQPQKTSSKNCSRRFPKSLSTSEIAPPPPPQPSSSSRRNATSRQNNSHQSLSPKAHHESCDNLRRVKSDLQWRREDKREYKQQNTL